MMTAGFDTQIIGEVIDKMADHALAEGEQADIAVERFSTAVDRLLGWLPATLRGEALNLARAHGYSSAEQIARMHEER